MSNGGGGGGGNNSGGNNSGGNNSGGNNSGGNNSNGGGGSRRRPAKGRSGGSQAQGSNRGSAGGRTSAARRRTADADFWGRPTESPPPVIKIKPSADPSALPRSLGDPPIGPSPAAAAHHLSVIYEEAVRAGTALAAASGLLEDEDAPPPAPA